MAFYDQEVARNNGTPNYQKLKTEEKLHIDPKPGTMLWKGVQSPRVKKETKAMLRGKWESVFSGRHEDNVPKKIPVVSVMSHSKAKQTDGERNDKEVKFYVDLKNVIIRHVSFDIFPCVGTTSLKNGCVYGDKCSFRHVEEYVKPNKKSKKGGAKGSIAFLKGSAQLGCVSQASCPRNLFYVNLECWEQSTPSICHQIKIRERKGPSRGIIQKCAPHERSLYAPKFDDSEETLIQERKIIHKLKNSDKATFYVPGEVKSKSTPITPKRPEEREFAVDSGASMHMMSRKESSSDELWTVKRSRTPTVVLTANGEVHTHEEAQVFVHDLNQVVNVQLLEETPTVPSLGKLCKDHGYSCEWVSGQEPRLTKNGKTVECKTDNFVPLVVAGLSTSSGSDSSETSTPQDVSSTSPAH